MTIRVPSDPMALVTVLPRPDRVVPVAVKAVTLETDLRQRLVGHLDALGILPLVDLGPQRPRSIEVVT